MSIHYLKTEEQLNAEISTVWEFFSKPQNLKELTPSFMNFEIVNMSREDAAYSGQIIEYKVNVMPWLRMKWVTEITSVKPLEFFVDEQRIGPYAIWHHEHHFRENEQGVIMTDIITYKLPFGFLGNLLHPFVGRKLKEIFHYRSVRTKELFS